MLTLLLAFVVQFTFAQEMTVTGTVVDEDGLPLPGVNVIEQGTNNGAQTNFDGEYSISVEQGKILVFSYLGFATQEITVGNSNSIDVTMAEDAAALDEVVVVGYGTATKQSFTGSAKKVDGEMLSRKNVADVSKALAGEVSGVRVINTSGQPGEDATIRIRGIGSVNGNRDPLYVVNGVPFNGSISSINPADVESTTILKDAVATAVYGARGANGVVVINTKSGKVGESNIEVELKTGQNFRGLPQYETVDSPERYIGLSWEAMKNKGIKNGADDPAQYANENLFSKSGISEKYNMWEVDNVSELIDPSTGMVRPGVTRKYNPENWEDYAFDPSLRTEANVRLSGGSEKSTYFSSLGYLEDKGYSVNSDFHRYTGRLGVTHDVKDWLSGTMDLGYSLSKSKQNGQSEDSGSVFWFVDNIPPIYPLFLRDENGGFVNDPIYGGNQYDYGEGRGFGALTNSVADANYNKRNYQTHELNGNVSLDAQLAEGLTFETRLGAQYFNRSYTSLTNPFYGSAASSNGSIYKTKRERFSYNFLQLLRYQKSFDRHSVEAFVAHESNSWEEQYLFASKSNLVVPDGEELNNAVKSSPAGSYTRDYTLESYFGQINYDYDDTYYLTATVRRDGSSRFLQDKWGNFGSVGASWVMSNEDFMRDQSVFDYLKLKASYGLVGEQAGVGYYPGNDLYAINNLNDEISLSFDSKGNRDLTWETSKQFQAGVELNVGSFLDVNVDYYRKLTEDLLFERRVAPSLGYALINVNDGELLNSGLEFDVTANIIKNEDYFLNVGVNGEVLHNELKMMPIEPATNEPKVLDQQGYFGRAKGHSIYDFYMKEYAGVDAQTGVSTWNAYYVDGGNPTADGFVPEGATIIKNLTNYLASNPEMQSEVMKAKTTKYADATEKFTGKSAIPDVRGAFNLNAGYKGFTLSAQLLYQIGGYSYDFVYARMMGNDQIGSNSWHTDILNRWQQPGDVTDVPRLSSNADQNVSSTSTRFLTKADYLALNNARIGYDFPNKFIEPMNLKGLSIFVSGDNLFLFSKRDGFNPSTSEAGTSDWYNYSPLTTITGGVRVKF